MNLVKEAIEKAQSKDKDRFSIERIALACSVSPSAMSNYKSGYRTAPPEVIVALSKYIEDIPLRDRHCVYECPIGKAKYPNGCFEKDLQTNGFMCGKSGKDLLEIFDFIYNIYSDGQCSRQEELAYVEKVLPNLYPIESTVRNMINLGEVMKCKR